MAICKSCGAKLKPNEKFCLECGTAVDEIAAEDDEVEDNTPAPSSEQHIGTAINIVKPKDISVLKKSTPHPPKKIPPKAAAPIPVHDTDKPQTVSAASASFKREVPDIELPEDNRYFAPSITDGEPPPIAHSMQNNRQVDFAKDFYSDDSITKKGVHDPNITASYAAERKKERKAQKKSPKPVAVLIAIFAIVAMAFYLYQSGMLNAILQR